MRHSTMHFKMRMSVCALFNIQFIIVWLTHSIAARESPQFWTWGPYRPNLYFGLRPQVPETLLVGLMWANGESIDEISKTLRDTCEQDDGMEGYGWSPYDTRHGGIQSIHDSTLHIDLDTEFIKSEDGKSWGVRIVGDPREGAPADIKTALIFHISQEQVQSSIRKSISCENHPTGEDEGSSSVVECRGKDPGLGSFDFHIEGDAKNDVVDRMSTQSQIVPEDMIWQAKAVFTETLKGASNNGQRGPVLPRSSGPGNMHFIQVIFEGAFQLHISYRQQDGKLLDAEYLNGSLDSLRSEFPDQVDRVFPRDMPFKGEEYSAFSQSMISNLLAGFGFFHGDSRADLSYAPEYEELDLDFWTQSAAAMERAEITVTQKASLLSHVPSRPFFPRGFLWDEGFHLLPIVEWDLDLAALTLQSWFGLMDADGWIGREQILGPEARSKVSEEFQTQYPHFANPPTLITLLPLIIAKITKTSEYNGRTSSLLSSPQEAHGVMRKLFDLASRQYSWFRRTQAGNFTAYPRPDSTNTEGYRWKGRTPTHCFTSGLDDYPRAEPPHPGELHVDALAWVGAAADALRQVADYLGEDSKPYASQLAAIRHNLDVLHWDPDASAYCDATIDEKGEFVRVCHVGYVSLMPFLLGHLNASHPNLPAMLDAMSDPATLLSPHGLRSLSAADAKYGTDENYWRSAVWVNLNVLAVRALQNLGGGAEGSRARELASDLRQRLVNTVFDSWRATGFFWEQYDDTTGAGQRSRAFTGWTACIILLLGTGTGRGNGSGVPDVVPSTPGSTTSFSSWP
ncbi:glycoside hydrolase family 63 protein [Astrocystis sublimbata]|nr:glycoside hydrolase family 63 protein [Astrocystis sublimbata]